MATASKAKAAEEATEAAESGAEKAAIEEQLSKIRSDIAELGETLAAIGSRRVKGARDEADHRIREMTRASEEAIDDLRRQLRMIERDLTDKVQEKPLQTLGIAAGVGFLVALVLRR